MLIKSIYKCVDVQHRVMAEHGFQTECKWQDKGEGEGKKKLKVSQKSSKSPSLPQPKLNADFQDCESNQCLR
jgi:hypothetical protein